ncbi:Pyruvate/Phosphoenolpyruvate kinase-like domain-containing protein [Podospora aff. communis PSN243]|uniref:Pyruvate/Phosphoenolpyruvate kinase-like domain-containing protein n=1 Tax=Podospora aff. communis PSN243 TaxID=3040156 RepID=A0AAV9GPJ9_9PEZI|nr:Pyruvate/Phosphoenolpyruvate kinase-like domain-containing protein [Podospora aff. communis PSN243]
MATSAALRRALLYVPSSSPRFLTKSLSLTTDNLTYDLEDSVSPSQKAPARTLLHTHLSSLPSRPPTIRELAVRINAITTPHCLSDLTTLAFLPAVDALVIPKVNSAADLTFVTDVLRHVSPSRHSSSSSPDSKEKPIKLIALIESALAITNLPSICAASPYLDGLIFAAEDFALDLSLTRTPGLTEFLYARSAIVTAARAFNLPSAIDLVCTEYRGEEGERRLREESKGGKGLGFNGKQCIHPSQVGIVQEMFAPSKEEVEWAVRVAIADDKASAAGRGAWTLDGKMIDAPVSGKARAIIKKAERCGFDIESIKSQWQSQEPE